MKNMYQTIKKTAIKYTLPVIMAGSMVLGSCSNCSNKVDYLPISKELSAKLKTEQTAYLDYLQSKSGKTLRLAEESFNKGIEDKVYTVKEMEETLFLYNKADSLYGAGKEFAKEIGMNYETMPKDAKKVQEDLNWAINGLDWRKSELEKKLKKRGYKIEVENPKSRSELSDRIKHFFIKDD